MDTFLFIVAKLGWAILKPSAWLLFLAAGTFLRLLQGARRTALWLSSALLGLLLVFMVTPVGSLALRSLEASYPSAPSIIDVARIIVLGGGESSRLSETWNQPQVNDAGDRFLADLALAQRHPEAVVLFIGGIRSLNQEA